MIIVSGAAGKLGRRVVELLVQAGAAGQVRALSRDPSKLTAPGVETRPANFDHPATLGSAFEGGDVLLLISTDNIVEPGARVRQHKAAIDAAKAAGVKHIVYTSAPEIPVAIDRDHVETERLLAASGLAWTALRNNLYTEFLVEAGAVNPGGLVGNTGAGKVAHVTRDDCAAAAVSVLLNPAPHAHRAYEITGPEALSRPEMAAIFAEILGRPVRVVDLDDATFRAGVLAAGVPEFLADVVVEFGTATRGGHLGHASTAVADLTGRPATSLRTFFEANRPALLAALGG